MVRARDGRISLILLSSLYGQWALSWWVLGHRPRPSLDDPSEITVAGWMMPITGLTLVAFLPVGCAAAVLNVLYIIEHRVRGVRLFWRVVLLGILWPGTFMLLRWDPGRVIYWWFD